MLTEARISTLDGIQATRLIKERFPGVAVLVLADDTDDYNVIDAIRAGAAGYILLKDMTPEELLHGIQCVAEGGIHMKTALLHAAVDGLLQNGQETLAKRTAEAAASPRGKSTC